MPQISKRVLSQEKLNKLLALLFLAFSGTGGKKSASRVLKDLLTSTEKIMIAKRLACFFLLEKEIDASHIVEALKLSPASVFHYKIVYASSPDMQEFIRLQIAKETIKNLLEDIYVEFVYGSVRKGRNWGDDKKIYYDHKRKRQEVF